MCWNFFQVDILYDLNLAIADVNGKRPSLSDVKNGRSFKVQYYIRRIPISQVPAKNESECTAFVNKIYQEKVGAAFVLNAYLSCLFGNERNEHVNLLSNFKSSNI